MIQRLSIYSMKGVQYIIHYPIIVSHHYQEISVMSWNIDGLSEKALVERFDAVISEIQHIQPTVVST